MSAAGGVIRVPKARAAEVGAALVELAHQQQAEADWRARHVAAGTCPRTGSPLTACMCNSSGRPVHLADGTLIVGHRL